MKVEESKQAPPNLPKRKVTLRVTKAVKINSKVSESTPKTLRSRVQVTGKS